MAVEIERKFLVLDDSWKAEVTRSLRLCDGLIAGAGGRKVRVRIAGDGATLTVKGPRQGIRRSEFEYAIPLADAERMLAEFCHRPGRVIEKTRHIVPAGSLRWEIDTFHGLLSGLTLAEIELPDPDTPIPSPRWLGPEVSGDPRFGTRRLVEGQLRGGWRALFPALLHAGRSVLSGWPGRPGAARLAGRRQG